MNDEYLWSKKGCDPEVQQYEVMLREFRFKRGDPPALHETNLVTIPSSPRRRLAWIFAFAAPAAAALIFAFSFAYPGRGELAARTVEREPTFAQTEIRNTAIAHHKVPDTLNEGLQKPARTFETIPRTLNRRSRQPDKTLIRSQKVKLTREEKHAYDQLMLALSIAGSKLKIVQDTIDRNGEADKKIIRNDK